MISENSTKKLLRNNARRLYEGPLRFLETIPANCIKRDDKDKEKTPPSFYYVKPFPRVHPLLLEAKTTRNSKRQLTWTGKGKRFQWTLD